MMGLPAEPFAAVPGVFTLHPGDVACVGRDDRLETLLGSCVSLVLTDPRRTVGAMCHVVHAPRACGSADGHDARFGDVALARLFAMLRARAIDPHRCLAWAYGGGNMFPGRVGLSAAEGNVGAANAAWALRALEGAGIALLGAELGGTAYRRLSWTVGPGAPQVQAVCMAAIEGCP